MTSGGDDIEKLLRELDAMDSGGASAAGKQVQPSRQATPAAASGKQAAKGEDKEKGAGGRFAFAVVAAVAMGVVGAVTGMFLGPILGWLPLLDFGFWATGFGSAFGAFFTALIAGPPRWFSS